MFEKLPFKFEKDDSDLVAYLKDGGDFPYLSPTSENLLAKLKPADFQVPGEALRSLWPMVLTDALKSLKEHASREYDGEIDLDSFFNRDSLGIDKLQDVLGAFADFESLLYGASPERYRDHVAHTFRVWIIGQLLLRRCLGGSLHIDWDSPPNETQAPISAPEWDAIWAVTALCHDIGYPLTAVDAIAERTTSALLPQGLRPATGLRYEFSPQARRLQETFLRLMSSKLVDAPMAPQHDGRRFLTHLQTKYYMKFANAFHELQHGVVSALVIARSLVYFLESDMCQDPWSPLDFCDARQFLIRREILRAIAAHTSADVYHLRFDTLAFLLFVVDELQSWGRPTFEQIRAGLQEPLSSEDDVVTVEEFASSKMRIHVQAAGTWKETRDGIRAQLRAFHRRLRLAVGSPDMKQLFLELKVVTRDDKESVLKLADRAIELVLPDASGT